MKFKHELRSVGFERRRARRRKAEVFSVLIFVICVIFAGCSSNDSVPTVTPAKVAIPEYYQSVFDWSSFDNRTDLQSEPAQIARAFVEATALATATARTYEYPGFSEMIYASGLEDQLAGLTGTDPGVPFSTVGTAFANLTVVPIESDTWMARICIPSGSQKMKLAGSEGYESFGIAYDEGWIEIHRDIQHVGRNLNAGAGPRRMPTGDIFTGWTITGVRAGSPQVPPGYRSNGSPCSQVPSRIPANLYDPTLNADPMGVHDAKKLPQIMSPGWQ